jgi:hypothetical protein
VADRVYLKPDTVKRGKKVVGWVLLLALNAFAVLYVLLFALSATAQSQRAWLASFLLWVVLDVVVASTAVVLVKEVLLPASVLPQLVQVKAGLVRRMALMSATVSAKVSAKMSAVQQRISNTVEEEGGEGGDSRYSFENTFLFGDTSGRSEGPRTVDAAAFLFVSKRLAQKFPKLRETALLREVTTAFPRHAYKTAHQEPTVEALRARRAQNRPSDIGAGAASTAAGVLPMVLAVLLSALPTPLLEAGVELAAFAAVSALMWVSGGTVRLIAVSVAIVVVLVLAAVTLAGCCQRGSSGKSSVMERSREDDFAFLIPQFKPQPSPNPNPSLILEPIYSPNSSPASSPRGFGSSPRDF